MSRYESKKYEEKTGKFTLEEVSVRKCKGAMSTYLFRSWRDRCFGVTFVSGSQGLKGYVCRGRPAASGIYVYCWEFMFRHSRHVLHIITTTNLIAGRSTQTTMFHPLPLTFTLILRLNLFKYDNISFHLR